VQAWGLLMRCFPGSFPSKHFDALTLQHYGEAYGLAVQVLEAEEAAARNARRRQ
jgi:hypothetical protein